MQRDFTSNLKQQDANSLSLSGLESQKSAENLMFDWDIYSVWT